jgi:hypothetical protein
LFTLTEKTSPANGRRQPDFSGFYARRLSGATPPDQERRGRPNVLCNLATAMRGAVRLVSERRPDVALPRRPTLARVLAWFSGAFMGAILMQDLLGPTPAISSVELPPVRPAWIEATRSFGAFALESHALDGLEQSYKVRRHRDTGARQDILTFGAVDAPGAYVRVALHRPGDEPPLSVDPLDLTAQTAAASSIDAQLAGPVDELKTKFGLLPIIDMHVWARQGPRACLAVAGSWLVPRLDLVAWWCNPGWELVQRGQVACLLDRLMLMSAGGDEQLAEFFARAERGRETCGTTPILGSAPKRPDDWIFAKAEPKLRGRLGGR